MLKTDLEKIGLSSMEARIYDNLIMNGDMSASELAKRIKVGRTNIYDYARNLADKGLISEYEKRNKIYYHAENPKLLKYFADIKAGENERIRDFTLKSIPKLSEIFEKNAVLPRVENIYGDSAFDDIKKKIYLEGSHHEIYYFVRNINDYSPPEPKYFHSVFEKNLFTYLFAGKGSDIGEFLKRDKKENRMTMLVDFEIDVDIIVCENLVIIGDFRKNNFAATVIKSFPLARTLTGVFERMVENYPK